MGKNDIYMIQGEDYKQMAIQILEAAGLADDIGDRKKRIGIKPNILGCIKASKGATTHPELVDAVLSYLLSNDFSDLVVLEGAWVGDRTARAVKYCGIYDICQKHQVPFIDLQLDLSQTVDAAGMPIAICKEALKLDYLINLPVLKGHCQTILTCALKNSKGLIPDSEKRRFHTIGLHKPIAHLNKAIHQDFILVDNICGDLDFEEGGNPVVMNRILGFYDPVLCDSFAAECIGYDPLSIEYIRLAEQLGIGSTDVAHANLIPLNEGALNVGNTQRSPMVSRLAAYTDPIDACSACYGSLIYALHRMEDEGLLQGKPKKSIAIGQGYSDKTSITGSTTGSITGSKAESRPGSTTEVQTGEKVGIGRCTKCFEKSLPGCPPKAVDIVKFLKEEWN